MIDALLVLRLDSQLNDYQIAYELLNRGVRFLTLLRLPSFPMAPVAEYQFHASAYLVIHLLKETTVHIARNVKKCFVIQELRGAP